VANGTGLKRPFLYRGKKAETREIVDAKWAEGFPLAEVEPPKGLTTRSEQHIIQDDGGLGGKEKRVA